MCAAIPGGKTIWWPMAVSNSENTTDHGKYQRVLDIPGGGAGHGESDKSLQRPPQAKKTKRNKVMSVGLCQYDILCYPRTQNSLRPCLSVHSCP